MKTKLFKILGVALPIMMVLTLALTLMPAQTPTAEAAVGQLRFERVPLPKFNAAGLWFLAPGTNLGPMAVSDDGEVMYIASSNGTGSAITWLLKSTNGGRTWALQTDYRTTAGASDVTSIQGIGLSPDYTNDQTIFVASQTNVYQSVDGAKNFSAMSQAWGGDNITSLDVATDSTGRASVIVGTSDGAYGGDVYVYSPATTGLSWKAQAIGSTYDILDVSFSPNYSDDEGIFAATISTAKTEIQTSFGYTQDGGGWGASIGPGKFIDKDGLEITGTTRARIAFPDDFDVDSIMANIAFVGFSNGTAGSASEKGDVYKVTFQSSNSTTEDMNVRGLVSTIRTATNIWSVDVTGDADAATILVGTNYWSTGVSNYYWTAYISNDSGESWSDAGRMSPTGGATGTGTAVSGIMTEVALSPSYASSGTAYAATRGTSTSAVSQTNDNGTSWQQISMIDWANTTDNYTVAGQTCYSPDSFLLMLETGAAANSVVLKTENGGGTYTRLVSYANEGIPANLSGIYKTGDYVFLRSTEKFWRSGDRGLTFPRVISTKSAYTAYSIKGADKFWTGHSDGTVWYTENSGRPWVKAEESDIDGSVSSISESGPTVYVSTSTGGLFLSLDQGTTFKRVAVNDLSTTTKISFTRDPGYADNHMLYGVVRTTGGGVWRIEVNEDDPDSTEWKRIDTASTTYNMNSDNVNPSIVLNVANGVLTVPNTTTVVAGNAYGGLWRSTNPTSSLDGTVPPKFYRINTGLDAGASWGYSTGTGSRITFMKTTQSASVPYYNQLMAMNDVLNAGIALVSPADGVTGIGYATSTTSLTREVVLTWEAKSGATEYQVSLKSGDGLETISLADSTTTGKQMTVPDLIAGKQYRWRVKASQPLISPWSPYWYFTVSPAEGVFDIVSPARGSTNVDTEPVFVWASYQGATGYEIVVSEDPSFAIIDYSRNVVAGLTMYKSEETLAYNTTYYWRARPAGGDWATGVFSTMAEPVAPTPPVVIEPTPPPAPPQIVEIEKPIVVQQAIPDYLLWMIIVVGAVLVIALIVLIVRTRRVT
ncbi:WD40/YVTN/BNR-like repeat-containing protein [Chloroflexota bacterium]